MRGWIHLWALCVSVVAGIVLVSVAGAQVGAKAALATAIYSITICGLFGISATYHRIHWKTVNARIWMKRADHSMIFLFIAGSYTPFAMLGFPPRPARRPCGRLGRCTRRRCAQDALADRP